MRIKGKCRLYSDNATTRRTAIRVAATAAAVLLGADAALAGSCERTSRDFKLADTNLDMSEHTTAHNGTKDQSFDVRILRSEGEKAQQTIAPGEMVAQLAKFGASNTVRWTNFDVVFASAGAAKTVTCSFRVKWDVDRATWDLLEGADAVCGDASALCPTCQISCDKSFHDGKDRWNTTFVIGD
jgi:hypothetical protein